MKTARRLLLLLAAIAAVVAGCGDTTDSTARSGGGYGGGSGAGDEPPPVACTEIGCSSGLFLDMRAVQRKLPDAERLKVCLRRRCRSYRLAKTDLVSFSVPGLRDGQRVSVRLAAFGDGGKVLLRRRTRAPVRKLRPNGPQCPPTCFQVAVRLDPKTLRLVVPG